MKYLIINADDFGMSLLFNKTILDLIDKGNISSTTVLVDWIARDQDKQIKKLISYKEKCSIGLHAEFHNEKYLDELERQFKKFIKIFGFAPTHLDVHKPIEEDEDFIKSLNIFSEKKQIPVRKIYPKQKTKSPQQAFWGSIKSFKDIQTWLKTLKDDNYYEILFHPGKYDPSCKSSYNKERELDLSHIHSLNKILKKNKIKIVNYKDFSYA